MGRPKLPIKRDRQLNIGLTTAERELLFRRAAAAGMRPVDYARANILSRRIVQAAEAQQLDPLLLNELSRVGNNINQIARQLNAASQPVPPSLEPLLQELRALLARRFSK
jgi:hypothetical protein